MPSFTFAVFYPDAVEQIQIEAGNETTAHSRAVEQASPRPPRHRPL